MAGILTRGLVHPTSTHVLFGAQKRAMSQFEIGLFTARLNGLIQGTSDAGYLIGEHTPKAHALYGLKAVREGKEELLDIYYRHIDKKFLCPENVFFASMSLAGYLFRIGHLLFQDHPVSTHINPFPLVNTPEIGRQFTAILNPLSSILISHEQLAMRYLIATEEVRAKDLPFDQRYIARCKTLPDESIDKYEDTFECEITSCLWLHLLDAYAEGGVNENSFDLEKYSPSIARAILGYASHSKIDPSTLFLEIDRCSTKSALSLTKFNKANGIPDGLSRFDRASKPMF